MKGVLIRDRQLKYVSSSRLQFAENVVRTCTFSVGGAIAASLLSKVQQWRFRPVEFVVICVGGNDLSNGRNPWDICRDILVRGQVGFVVKM